jgi:aquaporin Z
MSAYITEFVGTFILVMVGTLTKGDPLAIGGTLGALIYAGAHTSGGHYNGCITFGLWLDRAIKPRLALMYVGCQIAGALCAGFLGRALHGKSTILAPAPTLHPALALGVESLLSFAMVWLAMHVTSDKRAAGNPYYGLAIGVTVYAAIAAGQPWGCGFLNPTSALALGLVNVLDGGQALSSLWLYIAGPLVGSALGVFLFRLQVPADSPAEPTPTHKTP